MAGAEVEEGDAAWVDPWAPGATAGDVYARRRLRKQLPQLKKLPPRYVVWGDGTSDEMCTGIMTVSLRNPEEATSREDI